jgi:hypothetical protein
MTQSEAQKQQQARRMLEIFRIARQRYLAAGGAPERSPDSLSGNDYLTEAERQEILEIGEQIFDLNTLLETASNKKQSDKNQPLRFARGVNRVSLE